MQVRARHPRRVARLLRRLDRLLARPVPADCLLERPAESQDDENEHGSQHDDLPLGDGASRADASGDPDTGRSRQPVYEMTFAVPDDDAGAQKSDAGHDALDDAARVGAGALVDGQDRQCRPEANEAKRAHARRLAVKVTIEIDCSAEEARVFFGLPDVKPMQEAMMQKIEKQMLDSVEAMSPESIFRMWASFMPQNAGQFRENFQRFFGRPFGPAPAPREGQKAS